MYITHKMNPKKVDLYKKKRPAIQCKQFWETPVDLGPKPIPGSAYRLGWPRKLTKGQDVYRCIYIDDIVE